MKEEKKDNFLIHYILTGIWIALALIVFLCGDGLSMAANEIGDFIAGFAGAAAFYWLIVGFWMQRKELALQREELKLASIEYKRQAKAQEELTKQQKDEFEDLNKRKCRSMRSQLPSALSELLGYARNSADQIKELHTTWETTGRTNPFVALSLPNQALEKVALAVQYLPSEDSKKLASILVFSQIFDARLRSLSNDIENNGRVIGQADFTSLYYDYCVLHSFVTRPFEFGRGESETIEQLDSAEEILRHLRFNYRITDDDTLGFIERNWPPEYTNYASEVQHW